MTLKTVLLPAPLGPIKATISPARAFRVIRSTATRPPNRLVTPCTSSSITSLRSEVLRTNED